VSKDQAVLSEAFSALSSYKGGSHNSTRNKLDRLSRRRGLSKEGRAEVEGLVELLDRGCALNAYVKIAGLLGRRI